MAGVFPMRFVTLVTLATLVTLVSVVSLCYLVHRNGGFSRGTSYARNGLLIMQFKSRLLPLPTPGKGERWGMEAPQASLPHTPPRGGRAESPRLCAPWIPALLNF